MELQKSADKLSELPNCSSVEQLSQRAQLQTSIEELILVTKKAGRPWLVILSDNMNWVVALLAFVVGFLFKRRQ